MPTSLRKVSVVLVLLVLIPLIAIAGRQLTGRWTSTAETADAGVWTCSMHPQIRLDHPGRCPRCGMALVPVSQFNAEKAKGVMHASLETEPVRRREVYKEIRTVGKFDYNERRVAYIAARVAGRVDRVYADFTGVEVSKGDHLVDIYSPDLYAAQRELLLALNAVQARGSSGSGVDRSSAAEMLESVRRKLLLWGLLPEQIDELESTRKLRTHVTIYAPIGGVVIEKSIREGQYVKDGDPLYRIADLDPIWLYANIYEYDMGWIRYGQRVDVALPAYPGETFRGTITFIDPALDDTTRTIKVRVNLQNGDRRIKPQMYATAVIHVRLAADGTPEPTGLEGKYICPMHPEVVQDGPGKCPICGMPLKLVPGKPKAEPPHAHRNDGDEKQEKGVLAVPVTAILDTGRRQIAYRVNDRGEYELVEVKLGPRVVAVDKKGNRRNVFPVLDGLKEGDQVVVQSGFLLDSQRQIEGMPSLLYPEGSTATSQLHTGHGRGSTPQPLTPKPSSPGSGHQH